MPVQYCHQCGVSLLSGAKFCHACGAPVLPPPNACSHCQTINPPQAQFCLACGHSLQQQAQANAFKLDWQQMQSLPQQLRQRFQSYALSQCMADGGADQQPMYLGAIDSYAFRTEVLEPYLIELTGHLEQALAQGKPSDLDALIERYFQQIYWYLLVRYAKSFTPHPLSERILQYSVLDPQGINLHGLMLDHLALSEEKGKYYTAAIQIPLPKLNNARKNFFFHQPGEVPLVFLDQTLFGTGKEGLILSNQGLYWKTTFHAPAAVRFNDLYQLKYFANHLEINGIYCSVSPSFNYKLLKLLQRLQQLPKNLL